MNLVRISDGVTVDVPVPVKIVTTKGASYDGKYFISKWESYPDSADWNNALQSWAYRNGYEVPETSVPTTEVLARVKAYFRMRNGKRVAVRQHERKGDDKVNKTQTAAVKKGIIGATEEEKKLIEEMLGHHPESVKGLVESITVSNDAEFANSRYALLENFYSPEKLSELKEFSKTKVFGYAAKGRVSLNRTLIQQYAAKGNKGLMKNVLDHEIGHVVHNTIPGLLDEWKSVHGNDPLFNRFTKYSKVDHMEAFAESYASYVNSGGKSFVENYSKVFKFIDKYVKKSKKVEGSKS